MMDTRSAGLQSDLAAAGQLECQSCGATLQVSSTVRTTVCPYCASPSIVERPPSPDRPPPSFVVAFVVTRERALAFVKQWLKGKSGIFTRSGLRRATVDDVRGVYLPTYLYAAVAQSQYAASIGEDYTETETYTTT